ncbi:FKBP-type peptidyl-prolyl cis-trans isomerase [Candidatus Saccharibacteria bacterium]|nr:FKBP-type peptidyl-prolyl cis-trans isomerase [Candidatus Saccharibacteria bacterium]
MDEKYIKTSITQRIWIIIIAILLLGSTIATYVAIVASSNTSDTGSQSSLEKAYAEKQEEISAYATSLSDRYFEEFAGVRNQVKAYNAEAANSAGVQKKDIKIGDGRELVTGDLNYFAYYIGWCADESVFDSSFNDFANPASLKVPLYAGQGLIEGWNEGVVGMKLGGIREITMPGELAYGDSREICGGLNSPLKFIILAIEEDDKLGTMNQELQDIYTRLMQAYYQNNSAATSY